MKVTLTNEQKEAIFHHRGTDFEYRVIEETPWEDDGKYQYSSVVFSIPDGRCFSFDVSRSGSYFSEYHYDFIGDVSEVKKVTEYQKVERWVDPSYEPEMPVQQQSQPTELIQHADPSLSLAERWVHYKKVEAAAKKEFEAIKKEALAEVEANGGYMEGRTGKVQRVQKNDRKAKESIKTFLAEKGVLELCYKDEVDLKKVDEMIDAGVINKEDVQQHIVVKENPYLKLGK